MNAFARAALALLMLSTAADAAVPGSDHALVGRYEGAELVGYSASELLDTGRGIRGLVHPDDRENYWESQMQALDGDRDWHWQGRILTRDGELRWADIKASARVFDDGRAVWDGVVWDITGNKQIELELGASRAQLRELSAHLESVREEEKARIAGEKRKIEWGSQIRSYVLQPYRLVKDHRTGHSAGNADAVLDGDLDPFIEAYLLGKKAGEADAADDL